MALKSILDVDVNDSKFKAYVDAYKKYDALLANQPAAWKKVADAVGKASTANDQITGAMGRHLDLTSKIAKYQENAAIAYRNSGNSWEKLAKNSKLFADNIVSATHSLLRWGSITGALSGVLGLGGLFGVDLLAISAAGQRKSSSGLGVTPGQQKAFGLNYSRLLGSTDTVLGNVNNALTDPSQMVNLARVGITNTDGKNAAQVSAELVQRLHDIAQSIPTNQLGSYARSFQLGNLGISEEDLRRIKERPQSELDRYRGDFETNSRALDLSNPTQKAWEDLRVQLDRAKELIEQKLITSLTPLAPRIEKVSGAFADFIGKLLGSDATKNVLDDVATGLGWLGTELTNGDFKNAVTGFMDDTVKMERSIRNFVDGFTEPAEKAVAWIKSITGGLDLNTLTQWQNEQAKRQREFLQDPTNSPHPGPQGATGGGWLNWLLHPSSSGSDPRGIRNNNPLNLTYLPGQGATGSDGRFGVFATMEQGITAEVRQLELYSSKYGLDTIGGLVGRWAPTGENNTSAYAASVAAAMHLDQNARLNMSDPATMSALVQAMSRVETGRRLDPDVVTRGVGDALRRQDARQQPGQQTAAVHVYDHTGGNVQIMTAAGMFA